MIVFSQETGRQGSGATLGLLARNVFHGPVFQAERQCFSCFTCKSHSHLDYCFSGWSSVPERLLTNATFSFQLWNVENLFPFSGHVYLLETARVPSEGILRCLFFLTFNVEPVWLCDQTRVCTVFLWRKKLHVRLEHPLCHPPHVSWGKKRGFGRNLKGCHFLGTSGKVST